MAAPTNPAITIPIQNSLTSLLVVEMYARPCTVKDSKKVLTPFMFGAPMVCGIGMWSMVL